MENKQDLDTHTPQWIATWSQYLLQQFSTDQQQIDQAKLLIEEILDANLQGDSCIVWHDQNLQCLGHLAVSEQAAQNQVVPFVYDAQYLYLYRYWKLEQRLATQVLRLKQQQIQPIDVAP
ncbi:MAG: exodeoxyribonuclease V subunit alpha, partial [Acinetobacter sp.]